MTEPQEPAQALADPVLSDAKVDFFVPDEWPADVAEKLTLWRQGHLIQSPALTWLATVEDDPVTGVEGGDSEWEPFFNSDVRAPYGIVCSQTCDIGASGPGRVHPFVDVAPVMEASAFNDGKRKQIESFEVTYLVALTRPPTNGFWVADLRLSVPVSKALLAKHSPLVGFEGEEDYLNFAEMLAARQRRPALAEVLSEELPQSLDAYIAEEKSEPEWYLNVEQVRIAISGDRLSPTVVTIFVVEDVKLEAPQRQVWRKWEKRGRKLLKKHDVKLDKILFMTLDQMTARQYKHSIPLRIPRLGRPPVW